MYEMRVSYRKYLHKKETRGQGDSEKEKALDKAKVKQFFQDFEFCAA
jgi:hypothetical protein